MQHHPSSSVMKIRSGVRRIQALRHCVGVASPFIFYRHISYKRLLPVGSFNFVSILHDYHAFLRANGFEQGAGEYRFP